MAEQGDVGIGDVVVSNPAIAPVPNMLFGQEIVFVQIELGPISRSCGASAPKVRQLKTPVVVKVNQRVSNAK